LRDKTARSGQIGRACSIFGADRVFVYKDPFSNFERDGILLKTLLDYLNTPQYLRRRLYPRKRELEFVGLLPPLRTPLHTVTPTLKEIREGDVRIGIVERKADNFVADVGLESLLKVKDSPPPNSLPQLLKIVRESGGWFCVPCNKGEAPFYTGYDVKLVGSLPKHLRSVQTSSILLTSRNGRLVSEHLEDFQQQVFSGVMTLVFGSPERGLSRIFDSASRNSFSNNVWNFFPDQQTETIRLEEALLGCLSITNVVRALNQVSSATNT
jgi:predicted SPOUT superfamily RNA methylase MTH1